MSGLVLSLVAARNVTENAFVKNVAACLCPCCIGAGTVKAMLQVSLTCANAVGVYRCWCCICTADAVVLGAVTVSALAESTVA